MEINIISVILIFAFLYPLIRGYVANFSSIGLKQGITSSEADIGFVISIILGLFFLRKIFVQHDSSFYQSIYNAIPNIIVTTIEDKPTILYLVILPILILILYELIKLFFYVVNVIIMFPFIDVLERAIRNRSDFFKRVISSIFEIPRAISYVILLSVVFNVLTIMNLDKGFNNYLSDSKVYNYICKDIIVPIANSKLARQIPNIIDNSFKIEVREVAQNAEGLGKTITYYNGITLDEAVKSNEEIDNFARKLTSKASSDNEKAKILYEWVGSNIEYDDGKAQRILDNDFSAQSGAIPAFNERRGICFDYSCLYTAMCRAVGIKVRIITGEGFNGVSWVSHAWNQVLINGKWLNVDTTFYKGGDYYNSSRFNMDHRNSTIADTW